MDSVAAYLCQEEQQKLSADTPDTKKEREEKEIFSLLVHCKELPGFKYRHDMVRDVLFDVLRRAGVSVKKEAPVNFLTDLLEGRSTLRPTDVLIFGWLEENTHVLI